MYAARFALSAKARWTVFGSAFRACSRRHAYHSCTSFGFLRNASAVASSSGLNLLHNPVCASRKVASPLSAEIPAPVRATIFWDLRSEAMREEGNSITQWLQRIRRFLLLYLSPTNRVCP